jgi:hypothetical protein
MDAEKPDKLPPCDKASPGEPCYSGVTAADRQFFKNGVKWYLCGNGSFDNIKNYTLEGFTKGVIVGGIAGWEGGPVGVGLGALGGGVEGFFGGNAIGWVATAGCQAAGMYGPAS